MNAGLTRTAITLAAIFQFTSALPVSAADGAPAFIEPGKRYTLAIPSGGEIRQYQFRVLEIGNGGWVKVAMVDGNQVTWLNTNQALLIAPFPPQPAL